MSLDQDQVHGEITPEIETTLRQAAERIEQALPFVRHFEDEEKDAFLKPGDRLLALATLLPELIEKYQHLFPPGMVDAAELRRDLELHGFLQRQLNVFRPLVGKLEDTDFAVRHDIMAQLIELAHISDLLGAKAADLQEQMKQIKQYFKRHGRPKNKPAAAAEPQPE